MRLAYFSPIPFDGLKQRPQYLAEGLAQVHEVVYVDPTVSMMKYLLRGGESPVGFRKQIKSGLTVCRLDGTFSLHRSMEGLFSGFGISERIQLGKILREMDAVWIGFVPWYDLLQGFQGQIFYDWIDDNAQLTTNTLMRRLILRTEPALMRRANRLFVTARMFYDKAVRVGFHPVLVPNAVERVQADGPWTPAVSHESHSRVFGYVGMISHWFDLNAVQTIINAAPENRVVLVGPEEIRRLNHPRVMYVGQVPKAQIGAWIASFDVCLYPFQRGPLLDTINPVKLYEYLAQNKPILAVRSRETEAFEAKLYLYETERELMVLSASPLSAPFSSEEARVRFVAQNTWDSRVKLILEEMAK